MKKYLTIETIRANVTVSENENASLRQIINLENINVVTEERGTTFIYLKYPEPFSRWQLYIDMTDFLNVCRVPNKTVTVKKTTTWFKYYITEL